MKRTDECCGKPGGGSRAQVWHRAPRAVVAAAGQWHNVTRPRSRVGSETWLARCKCAWVVGLFVRGVVGDV